MKDYYAVFGLEPDAPADEIKRAYRRLARDAHPDRAGQLGDDAQTQATALMTELNEAYAILSDPKERAEYDKQLRAFQAGEVEPAPPPPDVVAPPPVAPPRPRARPTGVYTSVAQEFAHRLRNDLLTNKGAFPWKETKMEGFEWALEAAFFLSHYFVLARSFQTADPAAAQKFTTYANLAVARAASWWKADYFLFLLVFQAMSNPEQVQSVCRRFRAARTGAKSQIYLLDAAHGRSLSCSPPLNDKRFRELLRALKLGR